MKDNSFTTEFVSECIANDIFSTKGMCEEATKRIQKIDEELKQYDHLKKDRNQLMNILKQFNYDTKNKSGTSINTEASKEIQIKICEYLQTHENVTASDLIENCGGYLEQAKIYHAIKSLGEQDIIERDDDGIVIFGSNWDNRPSV